LSVNEQLLGGRLTLSANWKVIRLNLLLNILKGLCHEIEDGYTGFQVLDLKNLGQPEHNFRYLRVSFYDLLFKNQAERFLIKQLLGE
jgi:hypothetical protein